MRGTGGIDGVSGENPPGANQLRDGIAFAVLVIVLIIRPTGILGRKES